METQSGNVAEHENACARVAIQFHQRWLRNYVRGKLRRDRIYQAAYELLHSSAAPILDVGCGVGLLAFYLRERACRQRIGAEVPDVPAPDEELVEGGAEPGIERGNGWWGCAGHTRSVAGVHGYGKRESGVGTRDSGLGVCKRCWGWRGMY